MCSKAAWPQRTTVTSVARGHVFPGVRLYGCRQCDWDSCQRCYAALPGRAADATPPGGGGGGGGGVEPPPLPAVGDVAARLAALRVADAPAPAAAAASCSGGTHRFVRGKCKVCKGCGACTGFGRACLLHQEGRVRGQVCGCGGGPSGCADCGLCESCCGVGTSLSGE